jgi:hypothetical protein
MPPETPAVGPLTFELGPSFATPDAARLHEALSRAAPGVSVEISFHHVRDWEAAALAVLALDLAERGRQVAVRGLSQRQLRLLHYLGCTPRALAAGRESEPETPVSGEPSGHPDLRADP